MCYLLVERSRFGWASSSVGPTSNLEIVGAGQVEFWARNSLSPEMNENGSAPEMNENSSATGSPREQGILCTEIRTYLW